MPNAVHRRTSAGSWNASREPGIGALLRPALLSKLHQRPRAQKAGTQARATADQVRVAELEPETLRAQLQQAELIIDVQKKVASLLGVKTPDGKHESNSSAVESLSGSVGVRRACELLGSVGTALVRSDPQPALAHDRHSRSALTSRRKPWPCFTGFVDQAPRAIYATLLEEGRYLASAPSTGCWARGAGAATAPTSTPGRNCSRPPINSGPGTRRPVKWTYFHLYVILDVFSRCVVGWTSGVVTVGRAAHPAAKVTTSPQGNWHADRGSSMKSRPVALLLADLGVTKTHSRPHVSDDNPFSEALKTLKYRPDFPERFGSIEDARAHRLSEEAHVHRTAARAR